MTLFDMPSRETCRVRRARTNTPLQALALMNDVTYLESARALAMRMMREGGEAAPKRIAFAYNVVLNRPPTAEEKQIVTSSFLKRLSYYKARPGAASKLLKQGDLPNDPKLNQAELAAYTVIASTILNLDETITKE
jgi:hypothetical protein